MSLLFALDFQKRSAARVQKINLKACRCGLTGMCLCGWTVDLGVKNSRLLAARGTHWQAKSVSNRLALA
jgi:hypothetical protein